MPLSQQRKHCGRWADMSAGWSMCQVTNSGARKRHQSSVFRHFMPAPADLSIIPLARLVCRPDQWHTSAAASLSSPMPNIFGPVLSLLRQPSKRLGKILGWAPKPCWLKKHSLRLLDPFCPDMPQEIPTHTPCWVKGSFRSCCPPWIYLNWCSDPPSEFY